MTNVRRIKLDPEKVVAVNGGAATANPNNKIWMPNPDLSRVDEIGFADLMPGSGHGTGGYIQLGLSRCTAKPFRTTLRAARHAERPGRKMARTPKAGFREGRFTAYSGARSTQTSNGDGPAGRSPVARQQEMDDLFILAQCSTKRM